MAQLMDTESVVQAKGIGFFSQNYQLLETYLGMPLVGHQDISKLTHTFRQTGTRASGLPDSCCVIFEVDQNGNSARRAATLALHVWKARLARRKLARLTGHKTDLLGIYPRLDNPTAIFELNTPAADYMHKNVLPGYGSSLSATVKRLLAILIQADPGLAGVGLVVRFR